MCVYLYIDMIFLLQRDLDLPKCLSLVTLFEDLIFYSRQLCLKMNQVQKISLVVLLSILSKIKPNMHSLEGCIFPGYFSCELLLIWYLGKGSFLNFVFHKNRINFIDGCMYQLSLRFLNCFQTSPLQSLSIYLQKNIHPHGHWLSLTIRCPIQASFECCFKKQTIKSISQNLH